MTEKIYYQDQYLKKLDAKVLKVGINDILLDKTIFIPQSNTEPGDYGRIQGFAISGSKKEEDDVLHICPKGVKSLQEGDTVKLDLDWKKRMLAMKVHSSLHLLAGPFENMFNKRAVAGAVRGKKAYLVFTSEVSENEVKEAIEQANKDIEAGLEIKSYWDEKKKGFRWTQVGDYTAIPDGGLHVKTTKEIGKIVLISNEFHQGKYKVTIGVA